MIDVAQFRRSVAHLVALASGIENSRVMLIKGGDLPQIEGSYCSIKPVTDRTLGAPSPRYEPSGVENVLEERIKVATEFTFSVNFYRDNALQYANNMKSAPYRAAIKQHLYTNNIGWLRFGPINDLTGYFSGWWEERAQGKLVLLVDGLDINQVGQALSVDVNINDTME